MITFNGLQLFNSGPSSIDPGPLESRDAIAESPGSMGTSVITQGTAPQRLAQRGTLVADNTEALQTLIDTIQSQVGAGTATLVDQHNNVWADCLMQRFEAEPFRHLGPRYATDYEITYLQTHR